MIWRRERDYLHDGEGASQEQVGYLHLSTVNPSKDFGGAHSSSDTSEPPVYESRDANEQGLNRRRGVKK